MEVVLKFFKIFFIIILMMATNYVCASDSSYDGLLNGYKNYCDVSLNDNESVFDFVTRINQCAEDSDCIVIHLNNVFSQWFEDHIMDFLSHIIREEKIKGLDLSHSRFTQSVLDDICDVFVQIEVLDLSECDMWWITEKLKKLKHLRGLYVRDNLLFWGPIKNIVGWFTELEVLDLSGIKIGQWLPFYESTFDQPHAKLTKLYARNCELTSVGLSAICKLTSIKYLDISGNDLTVDALSPSLACLSRDGALVIYGFNS